MQKSGPDKVSEFKPPHPVYRWFMRLDSLISSALFEATAGVRYAWASYTAWLERFRIWGFKRVVVDLFDDGLTFGLVIAFGLVIYALPTLHETDDVWNRGRQYAMTFTDINGEIIGRRGVRQDDAIPLSEIPPYAIRAVLATEDARFYSHFGLDVQGTLRAIVANARADGVVQGGSTLTQQLAKNLFLSPERTLKRKVHEAFLALWIEARLSKDQILKMYLDRSYLGGGTYGVEAAAQYYFGKSIRDVNLSEAAMLAGLFKAPSKFSPVVNLENARARANVVLYRMLDVGFISQGELYEARRHPAQVIRQADYYSPDYFLDYAYKETLDLIESQGLQSDYVIEVKTTLDASIQKAAQKVVNDMLDTEGPQYDVSQAALVSMKPDGALKAIVGGRSYEESQFNRATDARRQPGSSFKPFVYLAALRNGYTPDTIVTDAPITIGNWSPQNYSHRYHGRITLTTALAHSYNSVPVRLMTQIGRKAIIDTARLVGLKAKLLSVPSLPLGTNEVTVIDMTTAYATFANGGKLARAYAVLEIRRPTGELVYSRARNAPEAPQVIAPDKIAELNHMLNQVVLVGTGRRANLGFTPQCGKTGTTQSYRDAWFMGYTAQLVTGVWFGNDDVHETRRVTGGLLPAMTWKAFMEIALAGAQPEALAGVPLDDTYAKYATNRPDNSVALPIPAFNDANASDTATPVAPQPRATRTASSRPNNDAVVSVFKDIFSLSGQRSASPGRSPSSVSNFNGRQFGPRAARAAENNQRLRRLLHNR